MASGWLLGAEGWIMEEEISSADDIKHSSLFRQLSE
jgi:hypothetical protein